MEIKEMLEKEIEEILNTMGDMAVNSEDYKETSDRLTKLIDRRNEMVKIEYEHLDKKQSCQEDNDLKAKQMEDEKKARRFKNGLAVANTILGVAVPFYTALICLNFERTDNVTTNPGREAILGLLRFGKKK